MSPVLIGVCAGAATTLAVQFVVRVVAPAWPRWKAKIRWWRCTRRQSVRSEECAHCGVEVASRHVHMLVSEPNDDVEAELGGFGGTFVALAFCAQHCPGGCTNPKCREKLVA